MAPPSCRLVGWSVERQTSARRVATTYRRPCLAGTRCVRAALSHFGCSKSEILRRLCRQPQFALAALNRHDFGGCRHAGAEEIGDLPNSVGRRGDQSVSSVGRQHGGGSRTSVSATSLISSSSSPTASAFFLPPFTSPRSVPRNVHAMSSTIPSVSITTTFSSSPSSLPDHPPDDVPAHHASPVVAFIIGLGIVTLASIMNAAGLNLTKLDHVCRSLLRSSGTEPMLCGTTGADECDSEGSAEEGLA